MIEILIIILITIYALISRYGKNDSVYGSISSAYSKIMSKFMPYNYDDVDEKDGERFSQLFHYADMEWAKEHPYLYFHMPEEELTWEVFAVSYVPTNFNYIQILKDSKVSKTEQITAEQMMSIVKGARDRSEYDYDVEVNEDDKILTLSTCTYKFGKNSNIRFIVMAKLVTEEDTLVETANITPNTDKVAAK